MNTFDNFLFNGLNLKETHCKNSLGITRIIYLYKEGHHTVRNKDDLDTGIKTKTSSLAL